MAQDHFERHNHYDGVVDWNFNVIYDNQPQLTAMVEAYRPLLTRLEFYDPIPAQWLHSTILRVGRVEDYTEAEMLAVAEDVQRRLQGVELPEFSFGQPETSSGNICFGIKPEGALEKLYTAVTEALEKVVGPDRATKSPHGKFFAHTSLVYTKQRDNEAETQAMLNATNIKPATFRIHHMPLIRQRPTGGHYEWDVVKDIPLG